MKSTTYFVDVDSCTDQVLQNDRFSVIYSQIFSKLFPIVELPRYVHRDKIEDTMAG